MPYISSLKESFAIAPIQDREAIVQKLAIANTEDADYYQGLVILQKIYNEVMKQDEPIKTREPTSIERELTNEMQAHLKKFSVHNGRYNELDTRFHLLIYPFDTIKSIEYIKKGLYLDLLPQQQQQQQEEETNDHPISTTTASVLDENLIDGFNVLKESLEVYRTEDDDLDIEFLGLSEMKSSFLEKNLLSVDEEVAFLREAFAYPTERLFGNDIMDRLTQLWKLQNSDKY